MRAGSIPWTTAGDGSPVVSGAVQWTAVVNPGAGRRRRRSTVARLGDALAARAVEIHVTPTAEVGREVARAAFARGEGVLACGGDGTVRDLSALACETGGMLAVVPLGAGNDFARALGYDHQDPLDALAVLDDGREVAVDLGRATTAGGAVQWFTTVAHTGLDGEVNRWANTVTWASGTALYAIAALRAMAIVQPVPMDVTANGDTWSGTAWLVAVGNTHCYGGGMSIVPTARPDDGRLDAIIVDGAVPRGEVVRRFPQMIRGNHEGVEGVHRRSGASITIDGPRDQDVWASGERVGSLPATIDVVPNALRVVVPPDSPVGARFR
jgi:diacylglycerol kinase (ATP)